jgi:putative tryptophan/tyrosine transport system substrate-binding protein
MSDMRRRKFIMLLSGAATWPLAARAQQPAMPVIGFLSSVSSKPFAPMVAAFHQGLKETGYVEGQNVAIEYRWAEGQYDRLLSLAADLVKHQVAVMAATGGPASGLAAKAATSSIPIVFISASDPVNAGLVSSLARPEGNATGVTFFGDTLMAKRLELVRELVPNLATIAVLVNPNNGDTPGQLREVQAAARETGQEIIVLNASTPNEIDAAFVAMVQRAAGALVLAGDPMFASRPAQIGALAARYAIPMIWTSLDAAPHDALASYGASLADAYRQAGVYVGKILKGAKPVDLPVLRPTQLQLMINLKTAKSLGLTVPTSILIRADKVIE